MGTPRKSSAIDHKLGIVWLSTSSRSYQANTTKVVHQIFSTLLHYSPIISALFVQDDWLHLHS